MLADLSDTAHRDWRPLLTSTTRPVSPWDRGREGAPDKARALRLLRGLVSWSAQETSRLATPAARLWCAPGSWKCGVVGMVRQLWRAALQQRGEPGWKKSGWWSLMEGAHTPLGVPDRPAGRWIWEASRLDPPPCGPGREDGLEASRGRPSSSGPTERVDPWPYIF